MATNARRADPDEETPESVMSDALDRATSETDEPVAIRTHPPMQGTTDYLPVALGAVDGVMWIVHCEEMDMSHVTERATVMNALKLRWPDVETVPESESQFANGGDTDG